MGNIEDRLRRNKRLAFTKLKERMMADIEPIMPRRTGAFISDTKAENKSASRTEFVAAPNRPYTEYLWNGVRGDGTPIHWTNPNTEPRWFESAMNEHREEWLQLVKETIINGK